MIRSRTSPPTVAFGRLMPARVNEEENRRRTAGLACLRVDDHSHWQLFSRISYVAWAWSGAASVRPPVLRSTERRCSRLRPTPIVHRRFTSPVAIGLTICLAPIFDEKQKKQSLTRPTAASGPLGACSGLAVRSCGPITCTARLPFARRTRATLRSSATFCHFDILNFAQHRFYPLIVDTLHQLLHSQAALSFPLLRMRKALQSVLLGESLICRSMTR
jgi:hypothetical protein